jgi:hypothetical protein
VLVSSQQCLLQFIHKVGLLVIFKTRRLLNLNFFIDVAIEKYTLDIHLIELDVVGTSIS